MFQVLVSDKLGEAGLKILEAAADVAVTIKTGLSPQELCAIIPDFDALIIRSGTTVTADVLAAGQKLQLVGRAGVGVDNVDINAATRHGIIVMNTPTANSIATAEQTLTLMLAANRHTAQAHASLERGEWNRSAFVGTELFGKTLGIIGFGRIGRLVAERARAFGMTVVAYDPFVSEEIGMEAGVTLLDLDDLLANADIITLHTVISNETRNLINAETLAKMKDGVILINVARGKLVDEAALRAALDSGKVRTAALDVFQEEPPSASSLIGHPQVLHTPHLGASSQEAQRNVAVQIAEQVIDALRGKDFRHAINLPFPPGVDFNAARPYLALAERLGALQAAMATGPLTQLEVEVRGEPEEQYLRPIATAMLKGALAHRCEQPLNYISAPLLAKEAGLAISQTANLDLESYPNLVACRAHWEGGERLVAGILFAGSEPYLVQVDSYHLQARLENILLIMQNEDVPGVIGQVGTILGAYGVNVGEWRMGRAEPGQAALSFISPGQHSDHRRTGCPGCYQSGNFLEIDRFLVPQLSDFDGQSLYDHLTKSESYGTRFQSGPGAQYSPSSDNPGDCARRRTTLAWK